MGYEHRRSCDSWGKEFEIGRPIACYSYWNGYRCVIVRAVAYLSLLMAFPAFLRYHLTIAQNVHHDATR
jgi:hypothetical protein